MKKTFTIVLGIISGMVSAPVALLAHPGHGHENPLSPGHYLANPEHYIPLALMTGAVLLAISAYRMHWSKSKQGK